MKIDISIIIVHYKVRKQLIRCLKSIYDSKLNLKFEILVVDNEGDKEIEKQLKKYKNVVYIKSGKNLGFGAGNNLGAKYAKGKYLFFLNPDTQVRKKSIDILHSFLEKNQNNGIVSPLILNQEFKTFSLQGYKELNPGNAIFSFSFLRKFFPKRTIFENYSISDWEKSPIREVDTVYGAALMMPSEVFNKVNGFDEDFFLYFEENDISKRVREIGYKLYINSNSKVIHSVAQSTKQIANRDAYFVKSRYLYFKKHFGIINALFLDIFLKVNKNFIFVFFILVLSLFLRLYNLSISMPFIGDQGWFYLSARDLLIYGKIPLVGITSSHIWLHQGPLWTYMLSAFLLFFNFNPLSGAYLTAIIGVLTVYLMYKLGSEMFSVKTGIIAALLYAVSPLIVFFDRMPFDPSLIPFFTVMWFYSIFKWLNGDARYFPFILFLIAVLYNLELATFTLFFPFVLIFIYGLIKNKNYVKKLFKLKLFIFSVIAILAPMLPVIIYDFSHGFKQTIVFFGWTIYKPFSFLIKHSSANFLSNLSTIINFILLNIQKIVFETNLILAILIFIFSLTFVLYSVYRSKKYLYSSRFLLLFFVFTLFFGIFVNQTPSGAYLPIIFPFIIFLIALFFDYLISLKYVKYFAVFILLILLVFNFYFAYSNTFIGEYKFRINAVNRIIALTAGKPYNLVGYGPGSQFESFTMNYKYLLWWKGHDPSNTNQKLKIIINETQNGIIVNKIYD